MSACPISYIYLVRAILDFSFPFPYLGWTESYWNRLCIALIIVYGFGRLSIGWLITVAISNNSAWMLWIHAKGGERLPRTIFGFGFELECKVECV